MKPSWLQEPRLGRRDAVIERHLMKVQCLRTVSQTEVKQGCVLRQSNWNVLEGRGLITLNEVRDCKRNMNKFGFVGDLRQAPEISCVYHSETAENEFVKDPSKATLGDGFQPKVIVK